MNRLPIGLLLGAAVALAGCSSAIKMRNPATGEVATCGPYLMTTAQSLASTVRETMCVDSYQRQGFLRTGN